MYAAAASSGFASVRGYIHRVTHPVSPAGILTLAIITMFSLFGIGLFLALHDATTYGLVVAAAFLAMSCATIGRHVWAHIQAEPVRTSIDITALALVGAGLFVPAVGLWALKCAVLYCVVRAVLVPHTITVEQTIIRDFKPMPTEPGQAGS